MAQEQHVPPPQGSAAWGFLRSVIGWAFSGLSLAAFFMALYNVFGVTLEVDRLARETACGDQGSACTAQFTMWERTPIAHSIQMLTPAGMTTVRCQREYILYGTWSCAALDGRPSRASASAAPASASASVVPASASITPAPPSPPSKPKPAARSR